MKTFEYQPAAHLPGFASHGCRVGWQVPALLCINGRSAGTGGWLKWDRLVSFEARIEHGASYFDWWPAAFFPLDAQADHLLRFHYWQWWPQQLPKHSPHLRIPSDTALKGTPTIRHLGSRRKNRVVLSWVACTRAVFWCMLGLWVQVRRMTTHDRNPSTIEDNHCTAAGCVLIIISHNSTW